MNGPLNYFLVQIAPSTLWTSDMNGHTSVLLMTSAFFVDKKLGSDCMDDNRRFRRPSEPFLAPEAAVTSKARNSCRARRELSVALENASIGVSYQKLWPFEGLGLYIDQNWRGGEGRGEAGRCWLAQVLVGAVDGSWRVRGEEERRGEES